MAQKRFILLAGDGEDDPEIDKTSVLYSHTKRLHKETLADRATNANPPSLKWTQR